MSYEKRNMYILGTIIIVLFWILFFSIKFFSQVRSYDGWADQKSQKIFLVLKSQNFWATQLDLFTESFLRPLPWRSGELFELRWEVGQNFQFGGFVGVGRPSGWPGWDPTLNHLGRVTREGLFLGLAITQKNSSPIAISARIGHMWQLRPGDEIPGVARFLNPNSSWKLGSGSQQGKDHF